MMGAINRTLTVNFSVTNLSTEEAESIREQVSVLKFTKNIINRRGKKK